MKKLSKKITALSIILSATACTGTDKSGSTDTVTLSRCTIQETIPGAKATGAFLTVNKADDTPLALVAAKAPSITDHVEIHEMLMKNNQMMMSAIEAYPLQKGDNIFKKGSYHIMLMRLGKTITAGERHELTAVFSDGSEKSCQAVVKTVEELTPKNMKPMNHKHMNHDPVKQTHESEKRKL